MTTRRTSVFAVAFALGTLVTLGACSSDSSDTTIVATDSIAADSVASDAVATDAMTGDAMASEAMASDAMSPAAMVPFGPGCAAVPADGSGSFAGMAQDPAATAASNNPALSTLVSAVKAAGLVDTLNGPGPFTILAPTNDAFAKIDPATLSTAMADPKGALTNILTLHVISGKALTAAELLSADSEASVQGGKVTFAGSGESVTVNGSAKIVCGDVKVGNGVVHIIDTVLMPA
jgi:pentapeptide MXKDX repeat protein